MTRCVGVAELHWGATLPHFNGTHLRTRLRPRPPPSDETSSTAHPPTPAIRRRCRRTPRGVTDPGLWERCQRCRLLRASSSTPLPQVESTHGHKRNTKNSVKDANTLPALTEATQFAAKSEQVVGLALSSTAARHYGWDRSTGTHLQSPKYRWTADQSETSCLHFALDSPAHTWQSVPQQHPYTHARK